MEKFTVNTTSKLFIAKAGVTSFDVRTDLYSDAKEHWIDDAVARGFDFPIRTIGGDPIGVGQFAGDLYFLRFGWQIRPDEADHQLLVTGNLFHDDGIALFVPTLGDFTTQPIVNRSNLVIAASSSGGTDWTSTEREQIRYRLGIDGTSSAPTAAASLVAEIWAHLIHSGFSAARVMRIIAAAVAGKTTGGPSSFTARDLLDAIDQIVGTADSSGNRTPSSYGS